MHDCEAPAGGLAVRSAAGAAAERTPLVALVGPPNSGKSTLFNKLTGLRQKVANYPGVTVEKRLGQVRLPDQREVTVVDLPGVYGLSARTLDEKVTRDVLDGRIDGLPAPDAVVLIVDCTRLEPQLMLVEPVLDRGLPTLLVLNMWDELEQRGGAIDEVALADRLGIEVVRANARAGVGVDRIRRFLAGVETGVRAPGGSVAGAPAVDGGAIHGAVAAGTARDGAAVNGTVPAGHAVGGVPAGAGAPAGAAMDAANAGAGGGRAVDGHASNGRAAGAPRQRIDLPVLDAYVTRRGRIRHVGRQAGFTPPAPSWLTDRLDAVFLHRFVGPLIFAVVVALVFQAIFAWAAPVMDGVELLVAGSGEWLAARLPESWYRSLLIDGVWMGVGSVVVFLPQILILFLFIGILEDSGYMARAAVIADRLMYRVGLQGRAFLPLLSAYACAVPAIMAARTVEDERDRLATIFIAPFMTCSARLPVYTLLIAAFIPERPLIGPFLGTRAATLLGLYLLGAVAAIGTAFLLKRTLLRGAGAPFLMELPPYRVPTLRSLGLRLWGRSRVFLQRVGKIILLVAVVLWGLSQVPRIDGQAPPIEESALGMIGHTIEPAIAPLGFDWRIGIGLVSSLAAREVIVGTLGTIYGVEDPSEGSLELQSVLQRDLSFGAAIGLMVFFAFALQCMSTVAVVRRETASWKWPLLQWSYMLVLAVVGAFIANRVF
ncbi:MAG TPA: ferrous iron transporter B [Longimicrobiales bacterium]